MKDPTDLEWISGILITMLVFYSIAMILVFIILLILGTFVYSLIFEDTLFTQDEFFLANGILIYLIGGFILLFSVIGLGLLKRRIRKQIDTDKKRSKFDPVIPVVGGLLLLGWILTGLFSFSGEGEFVVFAIFGPIIIGIAFLNWQVIDIPAKALALLGKKKVLKLSRDAAIPLVVTVFSLLPVIYALRFEDAPTTTIVVVYLETLFALGVTTTFVSIIVIYYHLSRQIREMKEVLDLGPKVPKYREDTRLYLMEK